MQTPSPRIWTPAAISISNNAYCYTKYVSVDTTTLVQSGPGSNDNEEVFYPPQIPNVSPSDTV